jgi:hypothetical protein
MAYPWLDSGVSGSSLQYKLVRVRHHLSMMTTSLREIRAVTANYFFWQGLRWIPMGVALMFTAATLAPGLAMPAAMRTWVTLPLVAVALWLSTSVAGSYYRRTFGAVVGDPVLHARRSTVKWFVVYPAMLASMIIDMKFAIPILLSGVVWGVAIELYRRSTGGGRLHYALASAAVCVCGLLPLVDASPVGREGMTQLVALLGGIYIVGGFLDHRALARILGRLDTHQ